MDRLRKRLEEFRLQVRQFIKYNWHNEPEGDQFRSLNILFIIGAVRYEPTQKWKRICWNAYCVVPLCSYLIYVLSVVDDIPGKFNLARATWQATMILVLGLCCIKSWVLNRYFEPIKAAQNFINSKPFASGDSIIHINNDSAGRKKFFQRLQLAILAVLVTVLIDETIFNVPIFGIDKLFGTPQILKYLGPTIAKAIHFLYFFTLCPLWFSKYCVGSGTICSLLYGFQTEYEMLVHRFGNILDNVYSDIEEELPSDLEATPELKCYHRDKLYWKYLKQRVNDHVKLHVKFVENMQLLKPMVKILFGIIYYHAMVCFSPVLYVLVNGGVSIASFILVSAIGTQLMECYMWCLLIDMITDINGKHELKIMDLLMKIPYSQIHHRKYTDMRTTLCIMKTFVRNHKPFSCGGVFPINVEAFTDLLHIGYTVFTFLRDMEKKHMRTRPRVKKMKKY